MTYKKLVFPLACSVIALMIGGCDPAATRQNIETTKAAFTGSDKTTNERINSAAKQAVRDGNPAEAVKHYEQLYRNDGRNPETALNYAQILRQVDKPQRAIVVLSPFVETAQDGKETTITAHNPDILLEYASAVLATGKYEQAETLLQLLVKNPAAADLAPQALNLIGVSLDARGMHKAAEPYYRDAIECWVGEPATVMNNLALNLTHQGYFDEALYLLRQASVLAPGNEAIAINVDLVSDLKRSVVATPTAPTQLN